MAEAHKTRWGPVLKQIWLHGNHQVNVDTSQHPVPSENIRLFAGNRWLKVSYYRLFSFRVFRSVIIYPICEVFNPFLYVRNMLVENTDKYLKFGHSS